MSDYSKPDFRQAGLPPKTRGSIGILFVFLGVLFFLIIIGLSLTGGSGSTSYIDPAEQSTPEAAQPADPTAPVAPALPDGG